MTTRRKVFFIIFAVAVLSGCITPPPDNTPIPTPLQTPNLTDTVSSNVTQTEIINVTTNDSDIIPNSEYEVYSSVISSENDPQSVNKIVILQLTDNSTLCDTYDCFQNFKNYSLKNDSILVDDFKNKNAKVYKLENKFSIPQTVILISHEELNEIFQNNKGWDAFYEKYPLSSGVISISRAGFNSNQTQAILYYGSQRESLDGQGYLIFLTKDEGKWIVKEKVGLWVS
ncbi:MAG: hypothetical protein WCE94_05125 [Candidatus Methanoperedens sp.]